MSETFRPDWNSGDRTLEKEKLVDGVFGLNSAFRASDKKEETWVLLDLLGVKRVASIRIYYLPGRFSAPDDFSAIRVLGGTEKNELQPLASFDREQMQGRVNAEVTSGNSIEFSETRIRFLKLVFSGEPPAMDEIEVYSAGVPARTAEYEPGDTGIRHDRALPALANPKSIENYDFFCLDSMRRIYRYDTVASTEKKTVLLHAMQGESEAFQMLIKSSTAPTELRVEMFDLSQSGHFDLEIFEQKDVYVREPSRSLRMQIQGKDEMLGPGFFPDILEETQTVHVGGGRTTRLWVRVNVSVAASAGSYKLLTRWVKRDGELVASFHVEVRVWNFALPKERNFLSVMNFSGHDPFTQRRSFKDSNGAKASAQLYEYLQRFGRVAPNLLPPARFIDSPRGTLVDWREFDEAVRELRFRGFQDMVLPISYLCYHDSFSDLHDLTGRSVNAIGEEWRRLAVRGILVYANHLEKNGWIDRFRLVLWDEPWNSALPELLPIYHEVRKKAPRLKLVVHSHPWTRQTLKLDVPVVANIRHYVPSIYSEILSEDNRWIYCNGGTLIDGPEFASRVLPWGFYMQGISGMTWFSVNSWRGRMPQDNPVRRPYNWAGGDFFLYPRSSASNEPLLSIRFEQWRDGLEDYELLTLFSELHQREPTPYSERLARAVRESFEVFGSRENLGPEFAPLLFSRPPQEDNIKLYPNLKWNPDAGHWLTLRQQIGDWINSARTR